MLTAEQFIHAIDERLRTARQIDLRYRDGLEPTAPAERAELAARLAARAGREPGPEVGPLLAYPRHFKTYWEYAAADESEIFTAEISLHNLAVALLEKDFSFIDYEANPELEYMKSYRVFDDHPFIGDGNVALVSAEGAPGPVRLSYYVDYEPRPMSLSVGEYLWCLTVTLGYTHWQYLFCKDLDEGMLEYLRDTYRPKMASDLQKVWPGLDLGEFFALADRAG